MDDEENYQIEYIVSRKGRSKNSYTYQCKWEGYGSDDNSWETRADLINDGFINEVEMYDKALEDQKKKKKSRRQEKQPVKGLLVLKLQLKSLKKRRHHPHHLSLPLQKKNNPKKKNLKNKKSKMDMKNKKTTRKVTFLKLIHLPKVMKVFTVILIFILIFGLGF